MRILWMTRCGRPAPSRRPSASAQVSSRTRRREARVRLETCALTKNDGSGSSPPPLLHRTFLTRRVSGFARGIPAGRAGRRRHDPRDRSCARRGRPRRGPRRPFNLPEGRLSESVAKALIEPGHRRRNVDIPRFFSPPIPPRSAFATDSDTIPPRAVPGAPPAPPRVRPPAPSRRSRPVPGSSW